MTRVAAFALFTPVVAGAALVVALGATYLLRGSRQMQTVTAVAFLAVYAVFAALHPRILLLSNALVIGAAVAAAALIGRSLLSSGALIALAVAASIADIVSFTAGPTDWLLSSESTGVREVLYYLTVTVPVEGATVPVIGIGDLLLFGAFYLGLRLQGVKSWVGAGVLCAGLVTALGIGLLRGGAFGIPFMAVGVLLLLWRPGRRAATAECRA